MDTQGRGRADDVDPADQWMLNPRTGAYEHRPPPPAARPAVPSPRAPAPGRTVPPPRGDRPARRGRKGTPRARGVLLWTGGTMALVLAAAGTAGYLYIEHLEGNVTTTDVGDAGSGTFAKDESFDILLIGTDKRTGAGNEGYGDRGSAGHADTNILLHVSEDRTNATALSIPRDLIVDIPDCPTKQADGTVKVVPGLRGVRFNRSLGEGGRDPGCAMRTVKENTGISVDHFMMADFNAVKTLTTAVDGVRVCVAHAVDDKESKLVLPAGESWVEGEKALAFLRTRHSFGNRGDLDRIGAQQQFLGSLMRKMASGDTLTSPAKLMRLAEAATRALTVDSAIGRVGTLKDIALELKKVPTKNIAFATVPVRDNPAETVKATVVLDEAQAPRVFAMVRDDVSLTEVERAEKRAKAAVADRLKGPRADASEVRVRVLNGGAPDGSARAQVDWLRAGAGVPDAENGGDAAAVQARTTLEYAPEQAAQARALAALLGLAGSALTPGGSVTDARGAPAMTLTLGKDFRGAGVALDAAPARTPDVRRSTADKVQCAS
ncbi:LCP family protein [Streptomyces sp. NPDC000134]|uniref:LCP family protein n=1 Tax=Streptomyces sp. NPDC000134 TaxID=3364536 RepID=UPI0036804B83